MSWLIRLACFVIAVVVVEYELDIWNHLDKP